MLSFSNGVASSVIAFIDCVDGGETGPWDATSLSSTRTLLVFPSEGSEAQLRDREGTGHGPGGAYEAGIPSPPAPYRRLQVWKCPGLVSLVHRCF